MIVECPHCNESIEARKTSSGRWILTPIGTGSGGFLGYLLGSTNGIAGNLAHMTTGKTAISATSVLGPAGLIIGAMAGFIFGDLLDYHQCPSCAKKLNI